MLSPRPAQGTSSVPRMSAPQGAWPANPPPPTSASTFTTSSAVPPPHTGWQPSFPPGAAAEWESKASDVDRLLSWHWAEFKRQESPEQSLRGSVNVFVDAERQRYLKVQLLQSIVVSSPAGLDDTSITDSPSSQRSSHDPSPSFHGTRIESSAANGADALDSLAELARRPPPFLQKPVSTAASTTAQACGIREEADEGEETSKSVAGDHEGNEQAKNAEVEEGFGEEAALEAADRLRKRLLGIARSFRS
ncbi:hypothetical protein JCM10021v2_007556 [Rhodotorula toruloides]